MLKFDEFVKERTYLKNVTPKTRKWYGCVESAMKRFHRGEEITLGSLKAWVATMREAGISPISCNTYITGINAYLRWRYENGEEGMCDPKDPKKPLKLARLKIIQNNIAAFGPQQIERMLQWKARSMTGRRLHVLVLVLLDTGLRIDEALQLERRDVDLDSATLRVLGKGQKYRTVPMSSEGRRALYRWLMSHQHNVVFPTRDGARCLQRNLLRDFKTMCRQLKIEGVRTSFHTLRHTFAINYLRRGGDVFRLQRILGHASLEMTKKYLDLQVADLQAVHSGLTVVGAH